MDVSLAAALDAVLDVVVLELLHVASVTVVKFAESVRSAHYEYQSVIKAIRETRYVPGRDFHLRRRTQSGG